MKTARPAKIISGMLLLAVLGLVIPRMFPKDDPKPVLSAKAPAQLSKAPRDLGSVRRVSSSSTSNGPESPAAEGTRPVARVEVAPAQANREIASEPKALPAPPPPATPRAGKREATDPWARVALASVGEDTDATDYWLGAVNNPALPPEERKDLIEDLNEDGFADPKHPSPEELPLIWNRLALLETMAPQAMDQVNADAIAEAYKDLMAMAQGSPHD